MAGGDDVRKMICDCLKYLVIKSRMVQDQIIPINWPLQRFCTVVNGIIVFKFTLWSDLEIDGWYDIHRSLILILITHTMYMHTHRRTVFNHDGHNFADTACSNFKLKLTLGTVNAWQCMVKKTVHGLERRTVYTLLKFYSDILHYFFMLRTLYCHFL